MQTGDSQMPRMAREAPSNKGKGKGTATVSFTSKIARSASGLAKEVVGSSDALDFSHGTSNALELNSKLHNGTSSRTPHHWIQDIPSRTSPLSANGNPTSSHENFRSSPAQRDDREINDFLDGSSLKYTNYLEQLEAVENGWTSVARYQESPVHGFQQPGQYLHDEINQINSYQENITTHDDLGNEDTEDAMASGGHVRTPDLHDGSHASGFDYHHSVTGQFSVERLNMILGHVSEDYHLTSARDLAFEISNQERLGLDHVQHERFQDTQTEYEQKFSSQYTDAELLDNSTSNHKTKHTLAHPQIIKEQTRHRPENKASTSTPDDQTSTSDFHCTRAICRQRFQDPDSIRPYPGARWGYKCPHEDCTAQFQTFARWTQHITQPHHTPLSYS